VTPYVHEVRNLLSLLLISTLMACGGAPPRPTNSAADEADDVGSFIERRTAYSTQLTRHAPATENVPEFDDPAGVTRVTFASDGRTLWGWLARPDGVEGDLPVLVYFHGGFFLKPADLELLRPFLDAGIAVFLPTLRGRNGNGGDFEMVYGEVDDARAAVAFIAEQPGIDAAHIYTMGHSMGGAVSAMLSLYPDAPVRITGSSSGIYAESTLQHWAQGGDASTLIRFDIDDANERQLRLFAPFAGQMRHRHVAYAGSEEGSFQSNVAAAAANAEATHLFESHVVPGDHFGALPHALAAFLSVVREDLASADHASADHD